MTPESAGIRFLASSRKRFVTSWPADSRSTVRTHALRRLRKRPCSSVLVQASWNLFVLRGPANGRHGRASRRRCTTVLPEVPIRQWVLTLPFPLRYRLAYDRKLMPPVLAAFVRAVFASLRRRARQRCGVHRAKAGAVTFVQRFGGALNLNVHFHSLVFDGVYEVLPDARGVRFVALPAPDLQEIVRVLADAVGRIAAALGRAGFGEGEEKPQHGSRLTAS